MNTETATATTETEIRKLMDKLIESSACQRRLAFCHSLPVQRRRWMVVRELFFAHRVSAEDFGPTRTPKLREEERPCAQAEQLAKAAKR